MMDGGHVPELDGLRGLAILIVIPHNTDRFDVARGWTTLPAMFAHSGWLGVQLFFVLSGFLITKNLLESRGAPNYYSAFYARRVLRIFPLYYLTLAFFLLLLPRLMMLPSVVTDSYSNQYWFWTFLCNWVQGIGKSIYWFPHFWSLAVEEQFYLVWPLVVAGLAAHRLQRLCIVLITIAVVIRVAMLDAGASPEMMYRFTFCRMDALAAGAIGAIVMSNQAQRDFVRRYSTTLLVASLAVLMAGSLLSRVYALVDPMTIKVGYTTISLSMLGVLLVAVAKAGTPTISALRAILSIRGVCARHAARTAPCKTAYTSPRGSFSTHVR